MASRYIWTFVLWAVLSSSLTDLHGASGGTISGSFAWVPVDSVVDLSAVGVVDWIKWGTFTEFAPDRKFGVAPEISDFTAVGTVQGGPYQYADNFNGYAWSDGTPLTSTNGTRTGVYKIGKNKGFQFTVRSDTRVKRLRVYVGAYAARGEFTASLSDGGSYSDSSVDNESNGQAGVYTITFVSLSTNQTLTVTFTAESMHDNAFGNVTLQAAALSFATLNNPPTAALLAPDNEANFPAPANITLQASAFDSDGSVTNVQFFSGTNKLGEVQSPPYVLVWTNVTAGEYKLSVRASDNGGASYASRAFDLFIYNSGGIITGSLALSATSLVLNAEGKHDWAHWGLVNTNSFDRKIAAVHFIPNFTPIGQNAFVRYADDRTAISWTNGTPTASASDVRSGIGVAGFTNGYELRVPADTNLRTLRVYASVNAAEGAFQAVLSDYSAPAYVEHRDRNIYNPMYRTFAVTYAAATTGQTLRVRFAAAGIYDSTFGVVKLHSATFVGAPPSVSIASPTETQRILEHTNVLITANASAPDGQIQLVEFFEGTNNLGQSSASPYSLTWSNVPRGSFMLTAKATDDVGVTRTSSPVTINVVTNQWPSIALLSPTNGASFIAPAAISLEAMAADADGSIALVEFFAGTNKVGTVTNSPFTFLWANVPPDNYSISAKATDAEGGSNYSAPVAVTVVSNQSPVVAITNPLPGSVFFAPANIALSADAVDYDGNVTQVEFFYGTNLLAEVTNAPFTFVWTNVLRGNYAVFARATDERGASTDSATVEFFVSNSPPVVMITNLTNGATFVAPASITITAEAFDPDGSIQLVEFFAGTNQLGLVTNAPFTLVWSNVNAGDYLISARATDDFGTVTVSSLVAITVSNQPPTVVITNPISGSAFFAPATIALAADASDANGLARVEFFAGTNQLGSVSNAPFTLVWSNVSRGNYSVFARATDQLGASSDSAAIELFVSNSPPVVTITNLTNGATFIAPATITIEAEAFDPDGSVQLVEFFAGMNQLGSVSNAPFTLVWSNVNPGDYLISARAKDDFGEETVSGAVLITVVSNQPPTVAITNPASGAIFFAPATVALCADTSDADGAIARVEFFQGTNLLAEVTNAPFTVVWSNVLRGSYTVFARATDERGASTDSATVEFFVSNSPSVVTITNLTNGASFVAPATITIKAEAFDPDGNVQLVEFFAGTNQLGLVTNAPFTLVWSNVNAGDYLISARATDDFGAATVSAAVLISVSNQPPTVVITNPISGSAFFAPAAIILAADASDANGAIARVEFFHGTNFLAQVTNAPFTFVWSNVLRGSYSVFARAFDEYGAMGESAPVSIFVSNTPPVVAITNLTNGTLFTAPATLLISADAFDPDGSIQMIEFFEGTNLLGPVTEPPYAFAWSNVVAGSYQLVARATDDAGAATESPTIGVIVRDSLFPLVITISGTTTNFQFGFATQTNWAYSVEANVSATPLEWRVIDTVAGDGTTKVISEERTNAQQFYRVIAR